MEDCTRGTTLSPTNEERAELRHDHNDDDTDVHEHTKTRTQTEKL